MNLFLVLTEKYHLIEFMSSSDYPSIFSLGRVLEQEWIYSDNRMLGFES